MLISHTHKFIFLKTKKTGGSTIESTIVNNFFDDSIDICTGSVFDGTPRVNIGSKKNDEPDGHKAWHHIKKYVTEEQWNTYLKFTVERNPYSKVVSDFYWKQVNPLFKEKLTESEEDTENFVAYMENVFEQYAPHGWPLYTHNDELMVDVVLHTETLKADIIQLFRDKFGLTLAAEMLHENRKKSGFRKLSHDELIVRNKDRKTIYDTFVKELKYFNYDF